MLEFSPRGDLYILIIIMVVFAGKMENGHTLLNKSLENDTISNQGLYKYLPFELFFAIADSIKYVIAVYIAKWCDRKFIMVPFALWFIIMGLCEWPQYFFTLSFKEK